MKSLTTKIFQNIKNIKKLCRIFKPPHVAKCRRLMRREKFANEAADVESTEADKDSVLSLGEYLAQFRNIFMLIKIMNLGW